MILTLTSGLFKGLQESLGLTINYTPLYRPEANGMLERNHQSLKNSIKASLVEMGETYQSKWIQFLPLALLG